jgi:hypothetical protein
MAKGSRSPLSSGLAAFVGELCTTMGHPSTPHCSTTRIQLTLRVVVQGKDRIC